MANHDTLNQMSQSGCVLCTRKASEKAAINYAFFSDWQRKWHESFEQ